MVNFFRISSTLLAGCLAAISPALAQVAPQNGVQTQTVVTVMPKNAAQTITIPAEDLRATVNGKSTKVTGWTPLRGDRSGLQIVFLIDNAAQSSLSLQYADIKNFIRKLPDGTQIGVAYMQNGNAVMAQNITADKQLAIAAFRLPMGAGNRSSPYFSLSSLARNWPSSETNVRREVLMITDGVDLYYGRGYDPNDPYVQSAISDSQKAGLIVHAIFYKDTGRFDNSQWTVDGAQNYLQAVADGTGGRSYWIGSGNPVSFAPFLDELQTRLQNQYELGLLASARNKTELQTLKVKVTTPNVRVDAPTMVVVPGNEAPR